ncbi:hypothetical protein Cni_G01236 [Canna indica]|uniref:Uncharacterized protein n=1 Tax=Canna indica TaxID=4628 RepID=A0AAQ3Q0S2_9LILI|nr:hypothetical protein Cni_G01236 [Canna indica]
MSYIRFLPFSGEKKDPEDLHMYMSKRVAELKSSRHHFGRKKRRLKLKKNEKKKVSRSTDDRRRRRLIMPAEEHDDAAPDDVKPRLLLSQRPAEPSSLRHLAVASHLHSVERLERVY